jgi:hypothetical protein
VGDIVSQAIERPAGAPGEVAEGVKLAREATRKLDEAERRIEMLVRNADGAEEAIPFDPEGGKSACKSP